MPKYAVVVCPACRNPFIIEPGPKTVSCRSCNKKHETSRLKVFIATDDFKQAQAMRGSINAHVCGDTTFDDATCGGLDSETSMMIDDQQYKEDKEKVDEIMRDEARQTRKRGQTAALTEIFSELSESGEVSIEEYWTKVSFQGISKKKFDEWVEKMVETGVAYYPRHGYLKKG